jgi:hypothetical protein
MLLNDPRRSLCRNLLSASLVVSAAIALALLTSLILMFASPPQLLTLSIPLPITLPVTSALYADASRSNLDLLGRRRNGGKKSRCGGDGEYIFAHRKFSFYRIDRIGASSSGGPSPQSETKTEKLPKTGGSDPTLPVEPTCARAPAFPGSDCAILTFELWRPDSATPAR